MISTLGWYKLDFVWSQDFEHLQIAVETPMCLIFAARCLNIQNQNSNYSKNQDRFGHWKKVVPEFVNFRDGKIL